MAFSFSMEKDFSLYPNMTEMKIGDLLDVHSSNNGFLPKALVKVTKALRFSWNPMNFYCWILDVGFWVKHANLTTLVNIKARGAHLVVRSPWEWSDLCWQAFKGGKAAMMVNHTRKLRHTSKGCVD